MSLVVYLPRVFLAYHSKGNSLWSGDLVNKGSFLTQVKLFTFFDGSELPFEMLVLYLSIYRWCKIFSAAVIGGCIGVF